jgi:hypothetical protein
MSNYSNDLYLVSKIWQYQLNMEYSNPTRNVRVSFKDIGAFGEYLTTNFYPGFVGGGSGGMGLDLINKSKKKAIEVKTCCTIQNSQCKKCKTKFNSLFTSNCPNCNHSEYRQINDSRFGINAKEVLEQHKRGFLENITLGHIYLNNYDELKNEINIYLKWYKIEFNDPNLTKHQLAYFENQLRDGKAVSCNLLPNSFDFYKLCPKEINTTEIRLNVKDINKQPIIVEKNLNQFARVSEDIMENSELFSFRKLRTFDYSTRTADSRDFTINIGYRKKNLGKDRGDTRTNVYKKIES